MFSLPYFLLSFYVSIGFIRKVRISARVLPCRLQFILINLVTHKIVGIVPRIRPRWLFLTHLTALPF
jgi:hypothetical protein